MPVLCNLFPFLFIYPLQSAHTHTLLCQCLFPRGQRGMGREGGVSGRAIPQLRPPLTQSVSIRGAAFALEKTTYFAWSALALCVKQLICSHYQAHKLISRVSKQRELFTSTTISHFVFLDHQHRSKILNKESASLWTLQRFIQHDFV